MMSNPNYTPWMPYPQQQGNWGGAHTPVVLGTPVWPAYAELAPHPNFQNPPPQQPQTAWAQRPRAYSQPSSFHPPPPPQQQQPSVQNDKLGYRGLSKRYPDLHPILAVDAVNFYWDVRRKPSSEIHQATFFKSKDETAFRTADKEMRLYSKQFPWSIKVKPKEGMSVTVLMVWESIYHLLQEEITDAEWAMLMGDKKQRERVEKAWISRTKGKADRKLKRVDWLGGIVMLRGLEKDDTWMRSRLKPGEGPGPQDWVVRLCE